MAFRKRREALRSILSGSACIRPGSVYDAISIRIAEDLGFEVGMFGGSVASLAVLGDPDIALITLTELAEQMRRMSRAAVLAGAGRCRSRLRQRAQRPPHRAGTGGRRRRRPHHRGHSAAAGFRAGQDAIDFARGGRRQDEGGAGRARRSGAGDHGAHRCGVGLRSRRRDRARQGLSRPPASMRCSSPASRHARNWRPSRPRRRCRSCSAASPKNWSTAIISPASGCGSRCRATRRSRPRRRRSTRRLKALRDGAVARRSEGPCVIRADRPRHARCRRESAAARNFSDSRNR